MDSRSFWTGSLRLSHLQLDSVYWNKYKFNYMFQFTSCCPVILWIYMRNELIQTNLAGYTLLFSHYSLRLSLKSNQITRESQWVFIKSNHFCLVSFAPWCCHSKSGSQRPYALHSASSSLSSIVHTLHSQDGLHSNTLLYQQPIVSGPRPQDLPISGLENSQAFHPAFLRRVTSPGPLDYCRDLIGPSYVPPGPKWV